MFTFEWGPRVLKIYRSLFDLLDSRERRRFWLLCGMILIMGSLELAGVASILPFLAVVSEPDGHRDQRPSPGGLQRSRLHHATFLIFLGTLTFAFILCSVPRSSR